MFEYFKIGTGLLFCLFFLGKSKGQVPEMYVEHAFQNHPSIRANEASYQAELKKAEQAAYLPDPQVDVSVFIRPMMLPMGNQIGSFTARQMFPWFGNLEARKKEALAKASIVSAEQAVLKNNIRYELEKAWYPMIATNEQLQVEKENLQLLQSLKDLVTAKIQYGKSKMKDVLRIEIQMDGSQSKIQILELKLSNLKEAFNLAALREKNSELILKESLPEYEKLPLVNLEDWVIQNPQLYVFDDKETALEAGKELSAFMRKPGFGVGLQYMPTVKRDASSPEILPNTGKDMVMPMVSFSVPIWKKKYDAAESFYEISKQANQAMKEQKVLELQKQVLKFQFELESQQETIELLTNQAKKTQQLLDLLIKTYSQESSDFEEILKEEKNLLQYKKDLISSKEKQLILNAELRFLKGTF
jgi:outer membrane protein TolC